MTLRKQFVYNKNILPSMLKPTSYYTTNINLLYRAKCTCKSLPGGFCLYTISTTDRRIDYLLAKCEGLASLHLPTANA